jgi:hypothetical protein
MRFTASDHIRNCGGKKGRDLKIYLKRCRDASEMGSSSEKNGKRPSSTSGVTPRKVLIFIQDLVVTNCRGRICVH